MFDIAPTLRPVPLRVRRVSASGVMIETGAARHSLAALGDLGLCDIETTRRRMLGRSLRLYWQLDRCIR